MVITFFFVSYNKGDWVRMELSIYGGREREREGEVEEVSWEKRVCPELSEGGGKRGSGGPAKPACPSTRSCACVCVCGVCTRVCVVYVHASVHACVVCVQVCVVCLRTVM